MQELPVYFPVEPVQGYLILYIMICSIPFCTVESFSSIAGPMTEGEASRLWHHRETPDLQIVV